MKFVSTFMLVTWLAASWALASEASAVQKGQHHEDGMNGWEQSAPLAAQPSAVVQRTNETNWAKPECNAPKTHDEADLCEQIRVATDAHAALLLNKLQAIFGGVGIIFVLLGLYYTRTAARAAKASAEVAEKAIVASRTAFVYAERIKGYYSPNDGGTLSWQLRPVWRNSGESQTKNLLMYVDYEFRDSVLPPGYNFNVTRYNPGLGLIAPKASGEGGAVPSVNFLKPSDVDDIIKNRKFFYIWGWVTYNDIFAGTPQHITRFCWRIFPVGDPFSAVAAQKIRWDTLLHSEGNCTDQECA